jgi:hypothetical protein
VKDTRVSERTEPDEPPFVKVTHIDEARRRQIEEAVNRHPSGRSYTANPASATAITTTELQSAFKHTRDAEQHPQVLPDPHELLPTPQWIQSPVSYSTPASYDEMASHAHEFERHPERAKPKTSGCYFCEDDSMVREMCEVCQHMVHDYGEWRAKHLPLIDI